MDSANKNLGNSSQLWISRAGEPSAQLCQLVASRVQERISAGQYSIDTIKYFQEVSFNPVADDLTVAEKRLEQLRKLCQLWDLKIRPAEITSHRRFIGPLIVAGKRLVYPILSAFLKDTLHQQRSFNAGVIGLLAELSEDVERLKRRG
jgi:hypothetical protein